MASLNTIVWLHTPLPHIGVGLFSLRTATFHRFVKAVHEIVVKRGVLFGWGLEIVPKNAIIRCHTHARNVDIIRWKQQPNHFFKNWLRTSFYVMCFVPYYGVSREVCC